MFADRIRLIFAAAALLVLAACDGRVSGTVQDKRHQRGTLAVMVYELCIGDSKDTCTWYHLRGKAARGWYGRCDIGEQYPRLPCPDPSLSPTPYKETGPDDPHDPRTPVRRPHGGRHP